MSKKNTCPGCGGSGLVKGMGYKDEHGEFTKQRLHNCPQCGGRGWYTTEAGQGCAVAFLCIMSGIATGLGGSWFILGSMLA